MVFICELVHFKLLTAKSFSDLLLIAVLNCQIQRLVSANVQQTGAPDSV